jgi:subtilisin family serine protease
MKFLYALFIAFLFAPVFSSAQAYLSPEVQAAIEQQINEISIAVTLHDQPDTDALNAKFTSENIPVSQRPKLVLLEMERAALAQADVITFIETSGFSHGNIKSLKIVNMIALKAESELVAALASHPAVRSIVLDRAPFTLIEPAKMEPAAPRSVNGIEPGLAVIGSPAMWAMGYTGRGTMAYSVDTGVWPNHPAIKRQYKGNRFPLSETWLAWDLEFPGDKSNSHGSHTDGTILGLDTLTNDTIGSAFNAYFIATDPVVGSASLVRPLSDYIYVYEWCLNPDGNIETSDDVPHAINNSWGREPGEGAPICDEDFAQILLVLEAAGLANVSSAGNEGPEPFTMSVPHNINSNLVSAFTVGSVNGNSALLPISTFSSRGPSLCGGEGSLLIKPEVSAPGQNVRSCINQDEYANYSGTSMACPHVVGAVLLLKEAFPYLPGKDLLEALYFTAIDLGEPGEDNTYGMGIINVFNAFEYLESLGNVAVAPNSSPFDLVITEVLYPTQWATCDNSFEPQIIIKNFGTAPANGFVVDYYLNGETPQSFQYDQILMPNAQIALTLPAYNTSQSGFSEFIFRVESLDDVQELDYFNNQIVSRFYIKQQFNIPFTETFETDLDGGIWHTVNNDNSKTWELFETAGLPNSIQSARMNLYDYGPVANQNDLLVGPRVLMPGAGSVYLDFDVAYQVRNGPTLIHDTLEVWISTDCELTQPTRIYQKGGTELSSWSVSTHQFVPQTAEQWRHEAIEISEFADEEFIVVYFKTINRKGNNVYVDNVAIYQNNNPLSVENSIATLPLINLYPNPANDVLNIALDRNESQLQFNVYDVSGRRLAQNTVVGSNNNFELNIAALQTGIYLIELSATDWKQTLRFVKQ